MGGIRPRATAKLSYANGTPPLLLTWVVLRLLLFPSHFTLQIGHKKHLIGYAMGKAFLEDAAKMKMFPDGHFDDHAALLETAHQQTAHQQTAATDAEGNGSSLGSETGYYIPGEADPEKPTCATPDDQAYATDKEAKKKKETLLETLKGMSMAKLFPALKKFITGENDSELKAPYAIPSCRGGCITRRAGWGAAGGT